MKVSISGISFTKSKNLENLNETIEFIVEQMNVNEINVNSQIIRYQGEKPFVLFDFKRHDKIRRKFGRIMFNVLNPELKYNIRHQISELRAITFKRGHYKGRSGKIYGWKQPNLTSKHIFLWQTFLESDDDLLFVLEDDAMLNPTNKVAIPDLCFFTAKISPDPVFINLISHFDLRSNYIETDMPLLGENSYYSKTLANTTGAYVINREMAIALYEAILVNPEFRVVGADWLIGLLTQQFASELNPVCLNIVPGIFTNGSLDSNKSSLEN